MHEDTTFWDAYNHLRRRENVAILWPDIEFYHDKGGLRSGSVHFVGIRRPAGAQTELPSEAGSNSGHCNSQPASKERRDRRGCLSGEHESSYIEEQHAIARYAEACQSSSTYGLLK